MVITNYKNLSNKIQIKTRLIKKVIILILLKSITKNIQISIDQILETVI